MNRKKERKVAPVGLTQAAHPPAIISQTIYIEEGRERKGKERTMMEERDREKGKDEVSVDL